MICRVLVAAVVFAQTAVAAYGCSRLPGTATAVQLHAAGISAGVEQADAAMLHDGLADEERKRTGHDDMAPMLPSLCVGHCQFGNQSADHVPSPAVFPTLLTTLYALPSLQDASELAWTRVASSTHGPPLAADPPHSILHCCLRD